MQEDRPWQSYHTVYTNTKAGMEGVDKERVQKIVYEMSKGSKYFESEQRKEAFIKQKIENMRAQRGKLTPNDISHFQMIADRRVLELEVTRDLSKIWLHIDMDAFYAAVETLENPSLKGKPMAVGSMSMICTANYEARRFGVRAAMPGFIACKLCPELILVPTNFNKYTYYSEFTRKVFQKYDPQFIATSLDEAYLDMTEVCKDRCISAEEAAEELRTGVFEETGLTCSAGIAPNWLLAKVCSDINKPNGQFVLPNDRKAVMTFISTLPIRKIGGIGKVTEHLLRDVLGIKTCEELLQKSAFLCALFSRSSSDFFLSVGLGLGRTDTPQSKLRKSISSERTFAATNDEKLLFQNLEAIAEMLSDDMQKDGLYGRTLTLKLKTASFEVRTRAVSLQKSMYLKEDILNHASKLLKAELPLSLRLIGLRMSQFNDEKIADPMQKTITSFAISRDPSVKVPTSNNSTDTEICDDCFKISDPEHESLSTSNDAGEAQKSFRSIKSVEGQELDLSHSPTDAAQSHKVNEQQITSKDASSYKQSESSSLAEETNDRADLTEDEAETSSNSKEESLWIDEYRCSICGIELPPSFVEERQEHSDYHLAEMLQKEESMYVPMDKIRQQQRLAGKTQDTRATMRKKPKSSPKDGKHLPIDSYFFKGRKNL